MKNLPPSNSEQTSSSFYLLDERIQRWVWDKGWTTLRDVQESAIPAIVNADRDVILAAATATGKTEAAFLPILTHLLRHEPDIGCVLYISPLKALINDQWDRLEILCEQLSIRVTPWHGDVVLNRKQKFLRSPKGVLLITPESLEAMFVNRGHALTGLFAGLRYVVVDELHAFMGTERGKQLQSLLHRTEAVLGRRVPRIGLSATLGDMMLAAEFLRPGGAGLVTVIASGNSGQGLKVLVRGIKVEESASDDGEEKVSEESANDRIADFLFETLRGSNNLVFPNSRNAVEYYADSLRRRCEREGLPNEFVPHHGNLSKDIREQTEQALKKGDVPATAICTSTLEMGIDIGSVNSVAQIGPPPSVAVLRQRLGRSGRRAGESAILRVYCEECELTSDSDLSDRLRIGLVQTIAMIRLLVSGWFEPPQIQGLHTSTLVQQLLSLIAQRGGMNAAMAWKLLVQDGPFAGLSKEDFIALLRELGRHRLIMQDASGLLLHGERGERLVNHYEFYCAFQTEDEFQIVCQGKTLGSLPVSNSLQLEDRIIFAGRRWCVIEVNAEQKIIVVRADPGGRVIEFGSSVGKTHDRVREEMQTVFASDEAIAFLDSEGSVLLEEARRYYRDADLAKCRWILDGKEMHLLTWRGDWVNEALALMLSAHGLRSENCGISVSAPAEPEKVFEALGEIARTDFTDVDKLLAEVLNLRREKWDWALPAAVLRKTYASSKLDLNGARQAATEFMRHLKPP